MKEGTFDSRTDRHLSRTPLVFDDQGWSELNDSAAQGHWQAESIGAKSAKRVEASDEDGIPTRLVMMHFERV